MSSESVSCAFRSLTGFGLGISSLILGSRYMQDCPAQPFIPIYLIVLGCIFLLHVLISVRFLANMNVSEYELAYETMFLTVINFLGLIWLILGIINIIKIYEPEYTDTASATYCNKGLYVYAFFVSVLVFIDATVLTCSSIVKYLNAFESDYQ